MLYLCHHASNEQQSRAALQKRNTFEMTDDEKEALAREVTEWEARQTILELKHSPTFQCRRSTRNAFGSAKGKSSLFDRQSKWQRRVSVSRERLRDALDAETASCCPFSPAIDLHSHFLAARKHDKGNHSKDRHMDCERRNERVPDVVKRLWTAQAERSAAAQERVAACDRELQEQCTFHPCISNPSWMANVSPRYLDPPARRSSPTSSMAATTEHSTLIARPCHRDSSGLGFSQLAFLAEKENSFSFRPTTTTYRSLGHQCYVERPVFERLSSTPRASHAKDAHPAEEARKASIPSEGLPLSIMHQKAEVQNFLARMEFAARARAAHIASLQKQRKRVTPFTPRLTPQGCVAIPRVTHQTRPSRAARSLKIVKKERSTKSFSVSMSGAKGSDVEALGGKSGRNPNMRSSSPARLAENTSRNAMETVERMRRQEAAREERLSRMREEIEEEEERARCTRCTFSPTLLESTKRMRSSAMATAMKQNRYLAYVAAQAAKREEAVTSAKAAQAAAEAKAWKFRPEINEVPPYLNALKSAMAVAGRTPRLCVLAEEGQISPRPMQFSC